MESDWANVCPPAAQPHSYSAVNTAIYQVFLDWVCWTFFFFFLGSGLRNLFLSACNYQNKFSLWCLLRSVIKPSAEKWQLELIIAINNDTSMSLKDRHF